MSDKDGTKVTESKESDAKKSQSKKNDGVSGNNNSVGNTKTIKDDKIINVESHPGAKSTLQYTPSTPPPSSWQ